MVTHVVLVDGQLASGGSAVRRTSAGRRCSLRASEVEGLGQNDGTGRAVGQVRNELSVGRWVDRGSRATTSNSLREAFSGSGDTGGGNGVGKGSQRREDHGW